MRGSAWADHWIPSLLVGTIMNKYERKKKLTHLKPKLWNESSYFEERSPKKNLTERQLAWYQAQYERGLAIASMCSSDNISDTFVNTYQKPSYQPPVPATEWVQPSVSSVGGPPHSNDYPEFGLRSLLPSPPPPPPPSIPPNPGVGFYASGTFPSQIPVVRSTENRASFPSFRFMKIRKRVKICAVDPRYLLNYQQLEALSEEILGKILTAEGNNIKPRFYGMEIRNGCLATVCGDETTLFWLRKIIGEMRSPNGMKFNVIEESEEEKMFTAVGNFQKSENDSNERILHFLRNQNEGLDVSRWNVVNRVPFKNSVRLTFLIDFASVEMLKLKGERLSYKFGVVRLMLKSSHGGRLQDDEIEDESDFFQESTQHPNPLALLDSKSNEPYQIPEAISSYIEEYKSRIKEMMEESKNSLLQGIAFRKRFRRRSSKMKPSRKKKPKVIEETSVK